MSGGEPLYLSPSAFVVSAADGDSSEALVRFGAEPSYPVATTNNRPVAPPASGEVFEQAYR